MAKELKGTATADQIEKWKKEHKDVSQISVGGSTCYLRRPTRHEVEYYTTLVMDKKPIRANETLLTCCWLGGDEAIKTDDGLFYGASSQLAGLLEVREAEIAKL